MIASGNVLMLICTVTIHSQQGRRKGGQPGGPTRGARSGAGRKWRATQGGSGGQARPLHPQSTAHPRVSASEAEQEL